MKARLLRILPLLAGVALMVLTVQLGNWQQGRAAEKEAIQARIDVLMQTPAQPMRADAAQADEWQPLRLTGVWLTAATRLIDNRTHQGQAGYHVLTPALLNDGSGAVLVKRGWAATCLSCPNRPANRRLRACSGCLSRRPSRSLPMGQMTCRFGSTSTPRAMPRSWRPRVLPAGCCSRAHPRPTDCCATGRSLRPAWIATAATLFSGMRWLRSPAA